MENNKSWEYLAKLPYEEQKQIVFDDLFGSEEQAIIYIADYIYLNINSNLRE